MERTENTPELCEAVGEVNSICPVCGLSSEQYSRLVDHLGKSITEAVIGAISESKGLDQANDNPGGASGRQSAFVPDGQRVADNLASRVRKDRAWLQWRNADH